MIRLEEIPARVSQLLGGRPARWASAERLIGDYDGRSRTVEVFNADPGEQRQLLRRLRPARPELEQAADGPLIIIFHTRKETQRLYSDLLSVEETSHSKRSHPVRFRDAVVAIGEIGSPRVAA